MADRSHHLPAETLVHIGFGGDFFLMSTFSKTLLAAHFRCGLKQKAERQSAICCSRL
jgi:hypothetical protein